MRPRRRSLWIILVIAALAPSTHVLAQGCPELLGGLPDSDSTAVAMWRSSVYLGGLSPTGQPMFTVVDASDPALPVVVGELELAEPVAGIAVSGSLVALASGGLRFIDVADQANPVEVGFLSTPDCAAGVALWRNYAFVAA